MDFPAAADLEAVNRVVNYLREHPDQLHNDAFSGLRAYMTSLGANTTPSCAAECPSEPDAERWELEDASDDDISDCAGADPTAGDEEAAAALKAQAAECAAGGKLSEAVDVMARALRLVPGKAMYWAQRADYLLKCTRPRAALRDANRALNINPENVRALRVRGTVNRHLGRWEDALKDLGEAQAVDYDEEIGKLLKFVQQKASGLRQRRRQAEETAQQKRQGLGEGSERKQQQHSAGGLPGGILGGVPPGMEALFDDPELKEAMEDPEFREAMRDPEVVSKVAAIMENPAAALQFMSDPKVGFVLRKLTLNAARAGFMPGGPPRPPQGWKPESVQRPNPRVADELD